jgi:hypothetical protein
VSGQRCAFCGASLREVWTAAREGWPATHDEDETGFQCESPSCDNLVCGVCLLEAGDETSGRLCPDCVQVERPLF